VCADAGTRYRRYSCIHGFGHAFMRINGDRLGPALDLCRGLGARAAADCAQGASTITGLRSPASTARAFRAKR
jgi:hypothetical protein